MQTRNNEIKWIATKIDKEGVTQLVTALNSNENVPSLQFLNINFNLADLELLLEALKAFPLKKLGFTNCSLKDAGISIVSSYMKDSKLQEIDLRGNQITSGGANAIFKALCGHKTAVAIDLSHNEIDDTALKDLKQFYLDTSCSISVAIERNKLSEDAINEINKLMHYIKSKKSYLTGKYSFPENSKLGLFDVKKIIAEYADVATTHLEAQEIPAEIELQDKLYSITP